jgi:hypothetical protein
MTGNVAAPEMKRMVVKLAAAMPVSLSAKRQNSVMPANTIIVVTESDDYP